jgi:hypothetical protein
MARKTAKQDDLFPDEARRLELHKLIPETYKSTEESLKAIAPCLKTLKTFEGWCLSLDVRDDRKTISEDIKVALGRVADLNTLLMQASRQLDKSAELEAEIREIEEKVETPEKERWDARSVGWRDAPGKAAAEDEEEEDEGEPAAVENQANGEDLSPL